MESTRCSFPRPSRWFRAAVLVASLAAVGCISRYPSYTVPSKTFVLSEALDEDGGSTKYVVVPGGDGAPAIRRTVNRMVELPYLGISPLSLDGQRAGALGLEPWRGVLLEEVVEGSAAQLAGLAAGDVLLEANGTTFGSQGQCLEWLAASTLPGDECEIAYLRLQDDKWVETRTTVTIGLREMTESSTDRFPLDTPGLVENRTGLEVATIPRDLVREIWDEDRSYAIVTSVIPGSPAYLGGLRSSDRIRECNGIDVSNAADLRREIERGATSLDVEVDGPLGRYAARFDTDGDMDERLNVNIPILYDHHSSVQRSRTSFLEFIFQFGFTKRHSWLPSATRKPASRSSLSILPLGMFEFESSPTRTRNSIFWLISWSSGR